MIGFLVIPLLLTAWALLRYVPFYVAGVFVAAALCFGYSVHWHLDRRGDDAKKNGRQ